jgi:hypothetical protein
MEGGTMPDLDVVSFWCCESVIHDEIEVPSSSGGTYTVHYEESPPEHEVGMWFRCECKSFQYRHTCKHIAQAKEQHCGWDAFLNGGMPTQRTVYDVVKDEELLFTTPDLIKAEQAATRERADDVLERVEFACPRCGGPVTSQRYGV